MYYSYIMLSNTVKGPSQVRQCLWLVDRPPDWCSPEKDCRYL